MSRSQNHFEEFQPHTRYKHLILKYYFEAWGHKLGLRVGAGPSILYVDGCAGRGEDGIGNQGSPLIAAVAAVAAQASVSGRRDNPFRIHIRAVESDQNHYGRLRDLLSPFGDHVRVLRGTLADHMDDLDRAFMGVPGLFFIDPFGIAPLDAMVIKRALEGSSREALLLFADQAALRHFGAILTRETRAEQLHRQATEPLPLFPDLASPIVEELASAAAESRQYLETTQSRATQIMDAAYGDSHWLKEVEGLPKEQRREALIRIYSRRLRSWGASHILHIPVVDISGTRVYTLIHASKSPKAYATMKEAVEYGLKHGPLPPAVTERMRAMVQNDDEKIADEVCRHFAGQIVRWADDPSNRRMASVRRYVLEHTPAFPFELKTIQARLSSMRSSGRTITYVFPAR